MIVVILAKGIILGNGKLLFYKPVIMSTPDKQPIHDTLLSLLIKLQQ